MSPVGRGHQGNGFYSYDVNIAEIQDLVKVNGPVGQFLSKITREMIAEMRETAPKRSRLLANSFVNAGQNGGGLRTSRRINNIAPYAQWVVTTTDTYTQPAGRRMMGPMAPHGAHTTPFTYKRRGYPGNPFMELAVARVLARNI